MRIGLGNLRLETRTAENDNKAMLFYQRTIKLCDETKFEPKSCASARFGMAQIIGRQAKNSARALKLAQKARKEFIEDGESRRELAKLDAWLKKQEAP